MRVTAQDIRAMKARGERIVMLTAYDYPTARLLDEVGIPILLVGDTLGMVVLGYETTCEVTLDDMVHHTRAVRRGAHQALIVADMPFLSHRTGDDDAVRAAGRLVREGGAQAVKLEGGADVAAVTARLVDAGIPVMGHIGLTPQSVHQLGGYRVQARTAAAVQKLLDDAAALERAGIFALVLECVPAAVGRLVTEKVTVPTIGIGAGPDCDGQVQVLHDILGLTPGKLPRHAHIFADVAAAVRSGATAYRDAVLSGAFPTERESFSVDPDELAPWRS